MRLNEKEIQTIKHATLKVFGEAKIMLFGSRVDSSKKGGDIDLYIIPQKRENLFLKKIRLKSLLEEKLYKPVDIVVAKDESRAIEKEALRGIEL